MCRRRRYPLILALLIVGAAASAAETVAVSVRQSSVSIEEPGLRELMRAVEEGAMDTMFASGHIVFDIDPHDTFGLTTFRAIDLARAGGASYLVLIDAVFEVMPGGRLKPASSAVTLVEVLSGEDVRLAAVESAALPGAAERTPGDLSLGMGVAAAESALMEMGEVESSW